MDPIQARLITKGKNGRTAEVAVTLGEGSQKRSVGAHVHLQKDGKWMGHNPDKNAITRLDAAEAQISEIKKRHDAIKGLADLTAEQVSQTVGNIRKFKDKAYGVPSGFRDLVGDLVAGNAKPEEIHAAIAARVAEAAAALSSAKKQLGEIGITREMEFTF